jgi:hypothetical protein
VPPWSRRRSALECAVRIYKLAKVSLIAYIIHGAFVIRGRYFLRYKGQSAAMEAGGRIFKH